MEKRSSSVYQDFLKETADLYSVTKTKPLSTRRFIPKKNSKNVAICLSGGGSRAMTAAMGQIRALKHLNLIDQTRIISSVSGGSWLSVPFSFLKNDAVSDDQFLNHYVADLKNLTPTKNKGNQNLATVLDYLPPGNLGENIGKKLFSPIPLALAALLLNEYYAIPTHQLWQTLIGLHILKPYDLFHLNDSNTFSYDEKSFKSTQSAYFVTKTDSKHASRPYLVCNLSMFVDDSGLTTLSPVQATPFFSGVTAIESGAKLNGMEVGGGGVSSFAFNSQPIAVETTTQKVVVEQKTPWTLKDITGTSSAFFASVIHETVATWSKDIAGFETAIEDYAEEIFYWIEDHLEGVWDSIENRLRDVKERKQTLLNRLDSLIPKYIYWPVADVPVNQMLKPAQFADGGNLENTGIAAALAYKEIDRIVAFVNAPSEIKRTAYGAWDRDGNLIADSEIYIDSQIPPLFGYQPYVEGVGYKLYASDESPVHPEFRYNQLFPSETFSPLLKALLAHKKKGEAAIFLQDLAVLPNAWFGVEARKSIKILWHYLDKATNWLLELNDEVRDLVSNIEEFPNFSTEKIQLNATEVNLLAHFTSWSIISSRDLLPKLYS